MDERYDPKTRILYITLKSEDLKNWPIEMSQNDLQDFDKWLIQMAQELLDKVPTAQDSIVETPIEDFSQANAVIEKIKAKLD